MLLEMAPDEIEEHLTSNKFTFRTQEIVNGKVVTMLVDPNSKGDYAEELSEPPVTVKEHLVNRSVPGKRTVLAIETDEHTADSALNLPFSLPASPRLIFDGTVGARELQKRERAADITQSVITQEVGKRIPPTHQPDYIKSSSQKPSEERRIFPLLNKVTTLAKRIRRKPRQASQQNAPALH